MNMVALTTEQPDAWKGVLDQCAPYDFYHLPQYHRMAEEAEEGEARVFCYSEGEYVIAMPLLLRSLNEIPHLGLAEKGWKDATSVYGFPGPVGSHRAFPASVTGNFQSALKEKLRDLRVVSAFSRLNPLFDQRIMLANQEVHPLSHTVAIDLKLPSDVQHRYFRRAFKDGICKLRRLGLVVVRDQDGSYFEDFLRIYQESMRRVGALPKFFFSRAYFERLHAALGSRLHYFVCLADAQPVCAGLLIASHGILQFHLGGTLNRALKLAPMKLLVDEVRLWAIEQGMQWFHLGGGATADPADTLLHFKKGFSNRMHEFAVWRSIVFPDVYRRLCEANARWSEQNQLQHVNADFFPEYRCPTVSRDFGDPVWADREPTTDVCRVSHGGRQ